MRYTLLRFCLFSFDPTGSAGRHTWRPGWTVQFPENILSTLTRFRASARWSGEGTSCLFVVFTCNGPFAYDYADMIQIDIPPSPTSHAKNILTMTNHFWPKAAHLKTTRYTQAVVYFDQRTGALHAVRWLKSNFWC